MSSVQTYTIKTRALSLECSRQERGGKEREEGEGEEEEEGEGEGEGEGERERERERELSLMLTNSFLFEISV